MIFEGLIEKQRKSTDSMRWYLRDLREQERIFILGRTKAKGIERLEEEKCGTISIRGAQVWPLWVPLLWDFFIFLPCHC